jgi:hypothetical protein
MTDTSKIVPVIHTVRDRIDPITKEPNGEIHGNQLILRATEELTEDERACIAGISENANGGITIKFNDKLKALELLMKYKGMLKDKVEVTGNINLGEYLDKVNGEEY